MKIIKEAIAGLLEPSDLLVYLSQQEKTRVRGHLGPLRIDHDERSSSGRIVSLSVSLLPTI